jgi:hypothetical protein
MSVLTLSSTQITNINTVPRISNKVSDRGGKERVLIGSVTNGSAAGDIGTTLDFCVLPYNAVVMPYSKIYFSALGSSCTLSVGYRATTKYDGSAITVAPAAFISGLNVASAGSSDFVVLTAPFYMQALDTIGAGIRDNDGLQIEVFGTIAGAVIPAAAVVTSIVQYVID